MNSVQSNSNSRHELNPEFNNGQYFNSVTIRFKKVFTTNIKFYTVCPDWTTQQLVEFIKPYVAVDFEIEQFDIVESGLPLSELANPIRISSNIKISEMFGNMNQLCLYIRERERERVIQ
jgi:hypothetical protein